MCIIHGGAFTRSAEITDIGRYGVSISETGSQVFLLNLECFDVGVAGILIDFDLNTRIHLGLSNVPGTCIKVERYDMFTKSLTSILASINCKDWN